MCFEEDGAPCRPVVENINAYVGQQESVSSPVFFYFRGITSARPDIEILDMIVESEIG